MKKIFLLVVSGLSLFSCQNESIDSVAETTLEVGQRKCASQLVLEEQLKADPSLSLRMQEIEAYTKKAISTKRLVEEKVVIPVIVNLLYRTPTENIKDDQIKSQIEILNKDFTATNSDFINIPAEFSTVAAKVDITFELVAINRKSSPKISWGTKDAMKSSKKGGIDASSPTTKLNIWVCTIGGGILGYAQFPGGPAATDGIVIDSRYFGNAPASSYPYNLGRTATHEVGHWMNLRHIWGDSSCGNDLVADTPVHKTANYGVPTYPFVSSCLPLHHEMTMNYMDYTDDRGMYMFSKGQSDRMKALFMTGGIRASFGK